MEPRSTATTPRAGMIALGVAALVLTLVGCGSASIPDGDLGIDVPDLPDVTMPDLPDLPDVTIPDLDELPAVDVDAAVDGVTDRVADAVGGGATGDAGVDVAVDAAADAGAAEGADEADEADATAAGSTETAGTTSSQSGEADEAGSNADAGVVGSSGTNTGTVVSGGGDAGMVGSSDPEPESAVAPDPAAVDGSVVTAPGSSEPLGGSALVATGDDDSGLPWVAIALVVVGLLVLLALAWSWDRRARRALARQRIVDAIAAGRDVCLVAQHLRAGGMPPTTPGIDSLLSSVRVAQSCSAAALEAVPQGSPPWHCLGDLICALDDVRNTVEILTGALVTGGSQHRADERFGVAMSAATWRLGEVLDRLQSSLPDRPATGSQAGHGLALPAGDH